MMFGLCSVGHRVGHRGLALIGGVIVDKYSTVSSLAERGGLASSRCAGLAELATCGRSVRTPFSGEGGIRTPKPVRAPVFETGALPFCHLSECRLPGCSWKLLKRPVGTAGEGAPRGLPLSNFRGSVVSRVSPIRTLPATWVSRSQTFPPGRCR